MFVHIRQDSSYQNKLEYNQHNPFHSILRIAFQYLHLWKYRFCPIAIAPIPRSVKDRVGLYYSIVGGWQLKNYTYGQVLGKTESKKSPLTNANSRSNILFLMIMIEKNFWAFQSLDIWNSRKILIKQILRMPFRPFVIISARVGSLHHVFYLCKTLPSNKPTDFIIIMNDQGMDLIGSNALESLK